MTKKQFAFIFFSFCFLTTTHAKTKISPVENKPIKNGTSIFYALPKNELNIKIKTIHTWHKKGPFYRYAGRFLAEDNIITEDHDFWSIKSIDIENNSIIDTTQIFQIKPSKNSIAQLITLNQKGIICSINSNEKLSEHTKEENFFVKHNSPNFNFDKSVLGEEALIANSTAKMAELAAKQIYQIRENRILLLTGDLDFPSDSESLKILLDEMNKTEQKLLELFIGKKIEETYTKEISFLPKSNTDEILIRFSDEIGLVAKDDLSGEPIYIKVSSAKTNLNLHPKKKEKNGLHYRFPATADISIYNASTVFIDARYTIAQFGDILILPQTLLKNRNQIIFDENNGQLIQIKTKQED